MLRPDIGGMIDAGGQCWPTGFVDDFPAHGVVDVDDLLFHGTVPEQSFLGVFVMFHGDVEIKVVAAQVGEDSKGKVQFVHPLESERMR